VNNNFSFVFKLNFVNRDKHISNLAQQVQNKIINLNKIPPKLDSSLASRGMITYSKSRVELQNLQILKKMLDKSSQFLSSEQLSEPKSLDVALNIAGVEKIRPENLRLRSTWRPSDSRFERKER